MTAASSSSVRLRGSQFAQADQPGRAAPHTPGDIHARRDEGDQRAPGDEPSGLHPGVIGEPRQRPEHPEERRGTDDDAEADQRRVLGGGDDRCDARRGRTVGLDTGSW